MHGVGDLTPAISNEVAVDSGKGVDKLGSVLVANANALAANDDARLTAFSGRERLELGEWMQEGGSIQFLQRSGAADSCSWREV